MLKALKASGGIYPLLMPLSFGKLEVGEDESLLFQIMVFKYERTLPIAYVLINVEMGSEPDILKKLRKLPNVREAHSVYGLYDLVAKVEFETLSGLKDYI